MDDITRIRGESLSFRTVVEMRAMHRSTGSSLVSTRRHTVTVLTTCPILGREVEQ